MSLMRREMCNLFCAFVFFYFMTSYLLLRSCYIEYLVRLALLNVEFEPADYVK